jgi:uncharacterized protein (TIGR01244 family)
MKATWMGRLLCGLIIAAIGMPMASAQESGPMPMIDVPNLKRPSQRILTAGQPDAEAWHRLAAQGVTTVINLCPASEMDGRDEGAEVAAAGLLYMQVPVSGAADITIPNSAALWRAIQEAPGPVLVHCASGNRVGALLAIGAANEGGMDKREALEFGKAAGLANAEPRVREVLQLPRE